MPGINLINCYTLIDITCTGVVRYGLDESSKKKRKQQSNYETLLQVLGLRTQPMIVEEPKLIQNANLREYSFGDEYTGTQNVWVFKFSVEYVDVYLNNGDPVGALVRDLNQVPIISGLDETVKLPLPIFSTVYDYKNTYFTTNNL